MVILPQCKYGSVALIIGYQFKNTIPTHIFGSQIKAYI